MSILLSSLSLSTLLLLFLCCFQSIHQTSLFLKFEIENNSVHFNGRTETVWCSFFFNSTEEEYLENWFKAIKQ